MITLISVLAGLLSAALPSIIQDIFGLVKNWQDNKHSLKMAEFSYKASKEIGEQKLEELRIKSESAETIHDSDVRYKTFFTGSNLIDNINNIGRLLLAFLIMGLYCVVTYMYYDVYINHFIAKISIKDFEALKTVMDELWTEEDQAMFAYIISFFFGERRFRNARQSG